MASGGSDDAGMPASLAWPRAIHALGVVEDRMSKAFGMRENGLQMCDNKEHVDCRRRAIL